MNYRHAFHAGNHTEVFKHAILVQLIQSLQKKRSSIFILDTHSGPGLYDLRANEAIRTGEAANGILRVYRCETSLLKPYLKIIRGYNAEEMRVYPGSPSIAASLLRDQDSLVLCELRPDDGQSLKALFRKHSSVHVHIRDGYEAMAALVPPPERRGLVFVDPPYEARDELQTLTRSVLSAWRKWPTGVYMIWYPIKEANAVRYLEDSLRADFVPNCLSVEFLRYPIDGVRLAGSGLVIINVPWQFEKTLESLCSELVTAFGGADESSWSIKWISGRK